jgi:hypothetical protein
MPIIYGTIGYTTLFNQITKKKILIFADMHDNLKKCNDYIDIVDWLKVKIKTSKILLEEVNRENNEVIELWKTSQHTQNLKELFLKNKNIKPVDIRPILIPFSWEILNMKNDSYINSIKKIILFDYLKLLDDFYCLKNQYLVKILKNYNIDFLTNSDIGIHFLKIKKKYKMFIVNNSKYLGFTIYDLYNKNINLLENINNLLDHIMEWYICANIILIDKSIILHTGLFHSENVINLLINNYNYKINNKKGINNLKDIDKIKDGCIYISSDINSDF